MKDIERVRAIIRSRFEQEIKGFPEIFHAIKMAGIEATATEVLDLLNAEAKKLRRREI